MNENYQSEQQRWQKISKTKLGIDTKLQRDFNLSSEQINELLEMCCDFEDKIDNEKFFNYREFEDILRQKFGFSYEKILDILLVFAKKMQFKRLAYIYTLLTTPDAMMSIPNSREFILAIYHTLPNRAKRESELVQFVDEVVDNTRNRGGKK